MCAFFFAAAVVRVLWFAIPQPQADRKKIRVLPARDFPMAKFYFADGKIYICRWQTKNLPFIRYEICHRPARHLPMANVSFADGKLKICNRQVRRWPSANFSFVIGKFFIFKREIFYRRQIVSFFFTKPGLETEQAGCSVSSCQVLERSDKPLCCGSAIRLTTDS